MLFTCQVTETDSRYTVEVTRKGRVTRVLTRLTTRYGLKAPHRLSEGTFTFST